MRSTSSSDTTLKVAVLFGGISPERSVSLRSGRAVSDALERLGHEVTPIDIQGKEGVKELMETSPDVALLTTHGEGGEDGQLQGVLEWLGIPYGGSGPKASALCMDKFLTKMVLAERDLPVCPGLLHREGLDWERAKLQLGEDQLFVKPRHGGSSIGARSVQSLGDWSACKAEAGLLIEPAMVGREVTSSLIQQKGAWRVLPLLELVSEGEFYDYECKYTPGKTKFLLPAPVDDDLRSTLERFSVQALEACGVEGFARVDFMLTEQGPRILEVNTLPGMTETSDLPAQAKAAGISFDALVQVMLDGAALTQSKELA